ncbi:MAG: hypothetical protein NT090_25255 [Acidobacteria bacterium]|nr:hypothetical protein [Acidobacteriota bacterium]
MTPDDAATLFVRLCVAGPFLYLGLVMAIDPASLVRPLDALVHALRTFEQRRNGLQWQEAPPESGSVHDSPALRNGVRLAGSVITAFAFLHLAGLVT